MTKVRRVLIRQAAVMLAVLAVIVGSVVALTDFPFSSDPTPGRIHYDGRDYDRGTKTHLPPDAVKQDATTEGGGVIYLDSGDVRTPTGLYVVDDGDAWGYGLVGGP